MNGAESLVRTLVAGGVERVLHQSRHVGDAFRRRARQGRRHALRARPVRGRGHRRGRRLLPHGRQARRDAAASRPGPRQRPRQPAQREQGAAPASSTSSASTRPITSSTTRRSPPTSRASRARSRTGCAPRRAPRAVAADGAAAIAAARTAPGQIATLILPADTAWNEADGVAPARAGRRAAPRRRRARRALRAALRAGEPADAAADGRWRCASAAWRWPGASPPRPARASSPRAPTRASQRGAGRVPIERLPYPVDQALARAEGRAPSDPGRRQGAGGLLRLSGQASVLTPDGCQIHRLATWRRTRSARSRRWPRRWARRRTPPGRRSSPGGPRCPPARSRPRRWPPRSARCCPRTPSSSDESVTTGRGFFTATAGAPPHDWLNNMGGSIGLGLPLATGAAIACPDRKVLCLEGDGSGMYTLQALWTQAREGLDVTTVVFANRTYAILRPSWPASARHARAEGRRHARPRPPGPRLGRAGARHGRAREPRDHRRGVQQQFAAGLAARGPHLIEAVLYRCCSNLRAASGAARRAPDCGRRSRLA